VCKKSITNCQPFVKKMKKCQVPWGEFFDSHCSVLVFIYDKWQLE